METVIDINGICISQSDIDELVNEIIKLLSEKNITHAIAYMILDEVKSELQNTIVNSSYKNIEIKSNANVLEAIKSISDEEQEQLEMLNKKNADSNLKIIL